MDMITFRFLAVLGDTLIGFGIVLPLAVLMSLERKLSKKESFKEYWNYIEDRFELSIYWNLKKRLDYIKYGI